MEWNIRLQGRAWSKSEAFERYELAPGKVEMIEGRLFWFEEDRIAMLGLLLENVGAEAAVRLGDPTVWKAAVAKLRA